MPGTSTVTLSTACCRPAVVGNLHDGRRHPCNHAALTASSSASPVNAAHSSHCMCVLICVLHTHVNTSNNWIYHDVKNWNYTGWNCRGVGGWEGLNPQFMSTDAHFWGKIGFKFQSLGKISNISTSDPPVLLGWFHFFKKCSRIMKHWAPRINDGIRRVAMAIGNNHQ